MAFSVCVYCSASTTDPALLELAAEVGAEIGRRGWTLVSGGGRVSMMGALASSARANGGYTIGVIPRHLMTAEVPDHDAGELLVTNNMGERKALMTKYADAFLALPGGIGTLEELFETWTGGYLGEHSKPVVVLDHDGFYDGLFTWLDELYERGFVTTRARDRISVARDVATALDALTPIRAI
ncbi:LOG family protein [Nocardia camponoti]|uniref:Cytokinin riboside 5'-monophosphate phosphoribohydrolase n=1 Tax=Nocardia camponoti TaxID=1616106 RepID=A0A917QF40_9NOCA|nr:TIGR00730 family Rossman fold protein [Nocardia camponoti]GGK47584.1 cytokinin riboside 5'-monophosphate phosphoribohydrolase [Nocardia camponoti]